MNTPRRTIRIDDETWNAARAKAQAEDRDVTDVIRDALSAYVKAGAAVLLAVVAILTLSACGSSSAASPASTPVTTSTAVSDAQASAMVSAQASAEASTVTDIAVRVAKGECYSTFVGTTADAFQSATNEITSEAVIDSPPANRIAVGQRLLASLPDDASACTGDDVIMLDQARDLFARSIDAAKAELG